jgi:hypothetical protein
MARSREKRKSGGSGWIWLFVALGLIAMGVFLFLDFGEDRVDEETAEAMEDTSGAVQEPQTGRITNFSTLRSMQNPETLVGRWVELDSVYIARVVSDSVLLVSFPMASSTAPADRIPIDRTPAVRAPSGVPYDTTAGRGMLVVLTGGEATATRGAVQQGQTIVLRGQVERLRPQELSRLGLAPPDSERVADQHVYLRAQRRERSQP